MRSTWTIGKYVVPLQVQEMMEEAAAESDGAAQLQEFMEEFEAAADCDYGAELPDCKLN